MEAVKLVQSNHKPLTQIARDLGIAETTLQRWRHQFSEHEEQTFPVSVHQTPQEEELLQLKRENDLLRQERDILKKAIGIFSRGQV